MSRDDYDSSTHTHAWTCKPSMTGLQCVWFRHLPPHPHPSPTHTHTTDPPTRTLTHKHARTRRMGRSVGGGRVKGGRAKGLSFQRASGGASRRPPCRLLLALLGATPSPTVAALRPRQRELSTLRERKVARLREPFFARFFLIRWSTEVSVVSRCFLFTC